MGSLSIQSNQVITPVASNKPAATPKAETAAPAAASSTLGKDVVQWQSVPASDRVKTAISTTFKSTILPYTIGGALAAPVTGAVFGGFIGLFAGTPGKGALEGAKFAARYMPITAAAGAGISGVDAVVMGTAVGSAPDRHSAMVRVGVGSAILGILTAEKKSDLLGAGVGAAAESVRAGHIFDKTNEALQKK